MNIPLSALPSACYGPYAACVSSVGKNLKSVREGRKLTQDQIAKLCGVPQNQWSKWESGRSEPKIKTFLRLALALDLPIETLVTGVNREFDLACQSRDQQSGLPKKAGATNDPSASRQELQRLTDLVARFKAKARKVLQVTDRLDEAVTALEEIGQADEGTSRRVGSARKAG